MGFLSSLFGSDDSSSSTQTTNQTSSAAYDYSRQPVASDSAVAIAGDGNAIDRSSTTNFTDTSNRSSSSITEFFDNSNKSTNFADSSDRSTNFLDNSIKDSSTKFTDNSDRSVYTTVNATDYGSVNGALTLSGSMTTAAFGVANNAVSGAIDVLKLQTLEGNKSVLAAFDMAKSSGANSMASSAAVLGFATNAIKETSSAFAEAKDGGQKKMVIAALVVVGIVGVAFAVRNS